MISHTTFLSFTDWQEMMTREAKQHMNGGMGPYELKRTFTDTLKVYESDPFSNRAPSQNRSTVKCLKLKILKTFSRKIANSCPDDPSREANEHPTSSISGNKNPCEQHSIPAP